MRKSFTFFIALLVANTTAFGFSGSGSGTSVDPYLVTSATQLNEVRNDFTAYYKQTADIDLSGYPNWTRIGNSISLDDNFTGTYDGDGHKVTGLSITSTAANGNGLFGVVGAGGVIKNLGVSGDVSGIQSARVFGNEKVTIAMLAGSIGDSKLNTIFTVGKVSTSAITTTTTCIAGGTGTLGDPCQVAIPAHLNAVRNHLGSYFIQTADIDSTAACASGSDYYNSSAGRDPIGNGSGEFSGVYDEQNYSISNSDSSSLSFLFP